MYKACGKCSPCDDNVYSLKTALIKSGTKVVMKKSKVMPVEPFHKLFKSWKENSLLSVKQLRLKAITLLAFALMLRPSDIAPKAVNFNPEDNSVCKMVFSVDQLSFMENGDLKVVFHGIKNDTKRDGFEVSIPPSSDMDMDPVSCLRAYIDQTSIVRPIDNPVFISLKKPYHALTAATIANILEEAIVLSGLSLQSYSAKCFRPTGATRAIEAGEDPDKDTGD